MADIPVWYVKLRVVVVVVSSSSSRFSLKTEVIFRACAKSLPVAPLKELVVAVGKMNLSTKFDNKPDEKLERYHGQSLKVS